jgi:two-component system response regulator HydG
MQKILVVDDEVDICLLLEKFLSRKGFEVTTTHKGNDALKLAEEQSFDLFIIDYRLPDFEGIDLLKELKKLSPETNIIVITGYSDIRLAVEVIKYGAYDYVTKPLFPEELHNLVLEALKEKPPSEKKSSEPAKSKPPKSDFKEFNYVVGNNPRSKQIHKSIELVAPTDMAVLITGETGTGKEFVAREIHRLSKRADKPFLAIDCGALPKDLAGSELFGHVKGAFTGALQNREGKFVLAEGGTLFLDEVGNLSYDVQVKLLRVLQERVVTKVGGSKEQQVDVRIIAATNENLKENIENGSFREDLYYRLNEFAIELPPLRSRREDLEVFMKLFIERANEQLDRETESFKPDAMDKLRNYSWPGNLRELRNVVKRSVLLSQENLISINTLPDEIIYYSEQSNTEPKDSLREASSIAEKERILQVLSETGNNKSKAARILNIDRKTLYNKLKNYDL